MTSLCLIVVSVTSLPRSPLGCETVINPLRMRRRVTVVCLCVCVCVCVSVTALVVSLLSYIAQMWYQCIQYHNSKVFNSWILLKLFCSKVIALFKLTFTCLQPFFNRKPSLLYRTLPLKRPLRISAHPPFLPQSLV